MQGEPEPAPGFSHKMSLKAKIGMLGIAHRHERFGSQEPGADPGLSGRQRRGPQLQVHPSMRICWARERERPEGKGAAGRRFHGALRRQREAVRRRMNARPTKADPTSIMVTGSGTADLKLSFIAVNPPPVAAPMSLYRYAVVTCGNDTEIG